MTYILRLLGSKGHAALRFSSRVQREFFFFLLHGKYLKGRGSYSERQRGRVKKEKSVGSPFHFHNGQIIPSPQGDVIWLHGSESLEGLGLTVGVRSQNTDAKDHRDWFIVHDLKPDLSLRPHEIWGKVENSKHNWLSV